MPTFFRGTGAVRGVVEELKKRRKTVGMTPAFVQTRYNDLNDIILANISDPFSPSVYSEMADTLLAGHS